MLGRNSSLGWRLAIAALSCIARCGAATAQGALPPPAVSVTPVVSRQVTETGDFIGRVTAIDKVDIVARVTGLHRGALLSPKGSRSRPATSCSASNKQPTRRRSSSSAPISPRQRRPRSTQRCNWSAARSLSRKQNIPQATVDQRAADEAAAQANVLAAQALLDQAEINLGYTEIRSPIDGRIGLAIFHRGQSGRPVVRDACDDRQPGPHLCHLSGQRARCPRLQAQGRRIGRQDPARDRSHQAAQWQRLSASRPHQLARRPGRHHARTPWRCGRKCRTRRVF